MRKWMRDRLKRKKTPEAGKGEPSPAPPKRLQPNQFMRNAQVGARIRGADGDAAAAGGEGVDRDGLDPYRAGLPQPARRRGSMLQKVMGKRWLSLLLPRSLRRAFPKAA